MLPSEEQWVKTLPKMYQKMTLDSCKDLPEQLIQLALDSLQANISLYMFGEWGSGKTTLAFALIREMMRTVALKGYFWPNYVTANELDTRLIEAMLPGNSVSGEIARWIDCNLVYIDDLDKMSPREKLKAQLFDILNGRMMRDLPTIITSNCDPSSLAQILDGSLVSRFGDRSKWLIVQFPKKDLRKLQVLSF